jgi:hypothetical protein
MGRVHRSRSILAAVGGLLVLVGCGGDDAEPAATIPEPVVEEVVFTVPADLRGLAITDERLQIGCALCTHGVPGADRCHPSVLVQGVGLPLRGIEMENPHAFCAGPVTGVITGTVGENGFVATKVELD